MSYKLKVSIITVCFNSEKTISDTIQSVISQNYPHIEHIIVDGASTDKTLEIINSYSEHLTFVSEKDRGIYDAMNKGISMAKGDIIGILNADDFYADNNAISDIVNVFQAQPEISGCYSDLIYVDQNNINKTVRYWKSGSFRKGLFKTGWMPAHPTFFAKKEIYDQFGLFDLDYKIAADFELLFRFIGQHQISTAYLEKVLIKMRTGGTTNKSLKNIWLQNMEIIHKLKLVYPDFSVSLFIFKKILNRTLQFIQKP